MRSFDYIVVGAGSAGCVLANRLSANTATSVLLVEAGPRDDNPLLHMPRGYLRTHPDPQLTWYFPVSVDDERREWPGTLIGGKVLGGSSAINSMIYVRGQAQDFKDWAADAPGWGWDAMAPCFRAIERYVLDPDADAVAHRPAHLSAAAGDERICHALFAAGAELGLPRKGDINEGDQLGIGFFPVTIRGGRRASTARSFLAPVAGRANLMVVTDTLVGKILFEGTRAVAISCRAGGAEQEYRANREIVLCAGALQSPKLLQHSGVGPAAHLRALGVDVVLDSPGVGENLRDHWKIRLQYRLVQGKGTNHRLRGVRRRLNEARYRLFRSGVMASASSEVGAFVKAHPAADRADAELQISLATTVPGGAAADFEREPGLQCAAFALRPESHGSVRIGAAEPGTPAVIRLNLLSEDYDRAVTIGMVRIARHLMQHPMMQPYIGAETFPGPDCATDDDIVATCRLQGSPGSHFSGTCRMGRDREAVVDEKLRVRGLAGLRVADASIMPSLVSGNINAAVMASAWRAADLILGA